MADVAVRAGIGEQVGLIAWLRWRLFRNSLRKTSARLDLAALIFTSIFFLAFVLGFGIVFGALSYFKVERGQWGWLAVPMWAVLVAWQLMPLMIATSGASFDFRSLLRFPLRFSVFFLLSAVYGLSDPAAVTALVWLVCITIGISLAQADLLPWTLLVLGTFAAMNLLLSRAIFSWVERLLARRRTREALWVLFFLVMMAFQFSGMFFEKYGRQIKPFAVKLAPVVRWLPPGLAGTALADAARGHPIGALGFTTLLGGYTVGFGLLLGKRLRAQYLGEDLGESPAAVAVTRAAPAAVSAAPSAADWLPGPVAAMVAKELRYLLRNTAVLMTLAVPILLIAFFTLSFKQPLEGHRNEFFRTPDLAFPGAIAYMFLIVAQLAHNSFAYEGRGIQMLFTAPVRFRDVLLGKNLVFGIVLLLETLLIWLEVSLLARPPRAMIVLATFSATLFAAAVNFMVGNWLSIQFPRKFDFGRQRRRAAGMTILIGFALQFGLLGLVAIVTLAAHLAHQMWILPVVFLVLSGIALRAYQLSLDRFGRLAEDKRELLTEQLSR